ncbi:MAG: transposase [Candidatus Jettenia sp.]|nr:transposase [Candidatus Jettenia sp.]
MTYEYLDHYTKTQEIMTLPVLEFIARLIYHIPDKHFRNIRYYGFLSHKLQGKLLPLVYNLLKMNRVITDKVSLSWRDMIRSTYRYDPLFCHQCKTLMVLQLLEAKNARDPTCPIKEECDICHTGFMIPVHYTVRYITQINRERYIVFMN